MIKQNGNYMLVIALTILTFFNIAPLSYAQKPILCEQYWQAAKQYDETGKPEMAERYWMAAVTEAEKVAGPDWLVVRRRMPMLMDLQMHPRAATAGALNFVQNRMTKAGPAEVQAQIDKLSATEEYVKHLGAVMHRVYGANKERTESVKNISVSIASLKKTLLEQKGKR